MSTAEAKKALENRPEVNRQRRLQAIHVLDGLLGEASDPAFRGTVGVELSAKDGRLSTVKATRVRFGSDESQNC